MPRNSTYFRLGLFVIVGLLLMAGLAITFGLGALFTETVTAETYFNESVVGLEQGSAVKYRGVDIGSVSRIGFLAQAYPSAKGPPERYVLVRMELRREIVDSLAAASTGIDLQERIARGLRIRLTTQGLTGVTYLEIDYLDPARNPLLPVTWRPEHVYIPSAQSTYSRLENVLNNISSTLDTVAKIDFQELVASLNTVIASIDRTLKDADVASLGELLTANLTELRSLLRSADALISGPRTTEILTDAAKAMKSLRRMAEGSEQDVLALAANLRQASKGVERAAQAVNEVLTDPSLRRGLNELPETMANLRSTSEDFGQAAASLSRMSRRVDELAASQRRTIESALSSLAQSLENLEQLTDDLAQNPSRAVFGDAPREVSPRVFGD